MTRTGAPPESVTAVPTSAEDQLAIMRTASRLAQAQDDGDQQNYRSLFTDSVELTASPLLGSAGTISAGELAERYFAAMSNYDGSQHNVFNHVIDLRDDEADCYAVMKRTDAEGGGTSAVRARYKLRLVRSGADWLISARDVSIPFKA